MPEWTASESTINDSDVNGQRQRTVGFDLPEGETSYIDVSHSRAAGSKDFPARSDSHYFREDEANRAAFLERAKEWNSAWEEHELERAWENEIVRRTRVRSDTQLYRDDEEGHRAFMERMERLARDEERGKDAPVQTKSYWGAGSQYDDVPLDRSTQMPPQMTQETPMLTKTDTQLFRSDEEKHNAFLERTGQIEAEKELEISSMTGGKAESTSRSSPDDARKPRRTDTFMHRQDETSHTAFLARMEADLAITTTTSTVPAKAKNQSTRNATQKKDSSSVDPDSLLFSPVRPPSRKSRVLMCIEKEWLCCEEEVLTELTSLEHKEGEIITWARHGVRQCDMWAEEVCACGL